MEVPSTGSTVAIESVKHDGLLHRYWEENTILCQDAVKVVGYNEATLVHETGKASWRTDVPVIFYFDRRYWFNILYLLTEQPSFYCNVSSPFSYANGVIHYIDYDLDILVHPNGDFEVVDQEEYEQNCRYYSYPHYVQEQVAQGLDQLINWIVTHQGPFKRDTMAYYYNLYIEKQRT